MKVKQAYNQWAGTYDEIENFTRDLDAIVTANALKDLHFDVILEIGCGTGKNTELLAQLANLVYALDFSPEMMAAAKNKVTEENVDFTLADLTQEWPRPDHAADLVVCNLVLEHIEDLCFIFSEANRCLVENGRFFISELHPFLQYLGAKATFTQDGEAIEISAFIHHISDFLEAAAANDLHLLKLGEWWHETDDDRPPRLVTFMFEKKTRLS